MTKILPIFKRPVIIDMTELQTAQKIAVIESKLNEIIDLINENYPENTQAAPLNLKLGKVYENDKNERYLVINSQYNELEETDHFFGINLSCNNEINWSLFYRAGGNVYLGAGKRSSLIKLSTDQRPYRV